MSREYKEIKPAGRPGAYGLAVEGIAPSGLSLEAPAQWPTVTVRQRQEAPEACEHLVDEHRAQVPLIEGGCLEIERRSLTATYRLPELLTDDDLLHPYFALAAAWVSHWLGREALHAGAVEIGGYAYGVAGAKEAGKSSLLAWFAERGFNVLSDDMVVISDGAVLTGPRCIDLRAPTVDALRSLSSVFHVRSGSRQRVLLAQTDSEWPLGGWIFLSWGEQPAMEEIPPRDRLTYVALHRGLRVLPPAPAALVSLAALPAWKLVRPRRWDVMDEVIEVVSSTVRS